jgi:hypothetical protein
MNALAFTLLLVAAVQDQPPAKAELVTERCGTAIEFVPTPVEAAKLAAKEKKLVFVLHVSGHFEDPDFT